MRLQQLLFAASLLAIAGCHPGPVIGGGNKPSVGGTIAGIVSTNAKAPVVGRKVTAINVETGTRYDATTGQNGGYTIKVPQGRYSLELELRPGERIEKEPGETRVDNSDLDPHRDFVIIAGDLQPLPAR